MMENQMENLLNPSASHQPPQPAAAVLQLNNPSPSSLPPVDTDLVQPSLENATQLSGNHQSPSQLPDDQDFMHKITHVGTEMMTDVKTLAGDAFQSFKKVVGLSPDKDTEVVYSPEAQMFVPELKDPHHPQQQSDPSGNEAGLLDKAKVMGAEVFHDVKDLTTDALVDLKNKATGAWNAIAGVVGAAPGNELSEDQTETIVAGADDKIRQAAFDPTSQMSVQINSESPAQPAAAELYPHGEIRLRNPDQ